MTEEVKSPLVQEETPLQYLMRTVSDNPAAIQWPSDQWGFTSEVRKAISLAAGKLGGSKEKEALLIGTIMVGLAHVKKRSEKDKRNRELRLANTKRAAEARKPLERFHAYK